MSESRNQAKVIAGKVFGVLIDPHAYMSTLYSLLAFPLGLLYFCLLIVGFSLGIGLLIVWIGLLVLALTLLLSFGFSWFERQQAIWLLGADIPPIWPSGVPAETFGAKLKAFFTNPVTWKGPLFLMIKFPLGIFTFVFSVVSLCLTFAFLLAPLYYRFEAPDFYWWYVDTLPEAMLLSIVGFFGLVVTLHAMNALGWVWKGLAKILLGASLPGADKPREQLPVTV